MRDITLTQSSFYTVNGWLVASKRFNSSLKDQVRIPLLGGHLSVLGVFGNVVNSLPCLSNRIQ